MSHCTAQQLLTQESLRDCGNASSFLDEGRLPINIAIVLASRSVCFAKLNTCKCTLFTSDVSNEPDNAMHRPGDVDDIPYIKIALNSIALTHLGGLIGSIAES